MPLSETTSSFEKQTTPAAAEQNQVLESLRRESENHKHQSNSRGIIGLAVTGVTEFWHGSSQTEKRLETLSSDLAASVRTGDVKRTADLEKDARLAIAADQQALKTASQIEQYGSGLIKSVGLFLPGKYGYALTAATAALDTYKPLAHTGWQNRENSLGSSFLEQTVDMGLSVTKAVGLKASFGYAASHNWGIAGSAVGLGVAARVSEVTLNRTTYQDNNGQYSAGLGLSRVLSAATDTSALASDTVSFVVARGALGKLNQGSLLENKMLASVIAGGIFGASKGSSDEVIRQVKAGVFEPGQFATHVAAGAATNMIGAAIGSKAGEIRALNQTARSNFPSSDTAIRGGDHPIRTYEPGAIGQAQKNFPGASSREYTMVGSILPLAEMLAASKHASALTKVREVKASGELGPEQTLLVQHHDARPGGTKVNQNAAAKADIIATCNPTCLPESLRGKHILSSAQETLWLTQIGDRLKFSSTIDKTAVASSKMQPVALGEKSVSSLLLDPNTRDMLRHKDTHDLGLYADVLRNFKIPAKRVVDGGADSVVIELANSQILKVTNQTWNPTWGTRTFTDAQGIPHRFDAKIIGAPKLTDGPYGPANFYIQERVITPVSKTSMDLFAARLDKDRRYSFWDRDESQLGYVDLGGGKRSLVLIDYDAVRPPHLVEKNLKKRWS